ncbi:MAG: integrase core domain-containing protein [Candidatus Helarchaeota archaeon]
MQNFQSPKEARNGLAGYLEFYDYLRPHQALSYQTPAEVYTCRIDV